jgi:hypothetical protein
MAAIVNRTIEMKNPMNPTTVRIIFDAVHNEGNVPESSNNKSFNYQSRNSFWRKSRMVIIP